MKSILKAGASTAALLSLIALATPSQAADAADPGCSMHGAVTGGYMYTNGSVDISGAPPGFFDDGNFDTFFGEGAGLVTCNAWNFQADFAYYSHEFELDVGKDVDFSAPEGHFGGAVFWRDSGAGALGFSGSIVDNSLEGLIDSDYYRVGVFGEMYLGDAFTLGASAHYFTGKDLEFADNKEHDGFELTANMKFYATPNFSLSLQGDLMLGKLDSDEGDADFDGFAITGEGEYLVWDEGLSLFAGARYAEREIKGDGDRLSVDDAQVFVGMSFAFGAPGTSLVNLDRTGPIDNTSTMFEKLPDVFSEFIAGIDEEAAP